MFLVLILILYQFLFVFVEHRRFRFDKEYLDISTYDGYSEMTNSIDNVSLGRHRDNTKRFALDISGVASHLNPAQGDLVQVCFYNLSFILQTPEPPIMYEEMIQKLEGDIRMHLRHENFLKLHIETLNYNLEVKEKELKDLNLKLNEVNKYKDQLEVAHCKELAEVKTHEDKLEKLVSTLKDKISELNMFITTNNAAPTKTLDRRDPMFMTLASQTVSIPSNNRIVTGFNDTYKGNIDYV
jgi:hypothetical protein